MEFMAKARITVSPWGWGDACYRDYEALLCQTEVIKPQGYPVRSIPDIYMQPGDCIHYVPPTWEGMEAAIDGILQTWDERQEARQTMRDILKRWRRPEAVAEILSGIVAGVM